MNEFPLRARAHAWRGDERSRISVLRLHFHGAYVQFGDVSSIIPRFPFLSSSSSPFLFSSSLPRCKPHEPPPYLVSSFFFSLFYFSLSFPFLRVIHTYTGLSKRKLLLSFVCASKCDNAVAQVSEDNEESSFFSFLSLSLSLSLSERSR